MAKTITLPDLSQSNEAQEMYLFDGGDSDTEIASESESESKCSNEIEDDFGDLIDQAKEVDAILSKEFLVNEVQQKEQEQQQEKPKPITIKKKSNLSITLSSNSNKNSSTRVVPSQQQQGKKSSDVRPRITIKYNNTKNKQLEKKTTTTTTMKSAKSNDNYVDNNGMNVNVDSAVKKGVEKVEFGFGEIGYTFKKYFPGHGTFHGVVIDMYQGAMMGGKYRRVLYTDGDSEDMDMKTLETLEPSEMTMSSIMKKLPTPITPSKRKRKRGRSRKNKVVEEEKAPAKRKRGHPPKNQDKKDVVEKKEAVSTVVTPGKSRKSRKRGRPRKTRDTDKKEIEEHEDKQKKKEESSIKLNLTTHVLAPVGKRGRPPKARLLKRPRRQQEQNHDETFFPLNANKITSINTSTSSSSSSSRKQNKAQWCSRASSSNNSTTKNSNNSFADTDDSDDEYVDELINYVIERRKNERNHDNNYHNINNDVTGNYTPSIVSGSPESLPSHNVMPRYTRPHVTKTKNNNKVRKSIITSTSSSNANAYGSGGLLKSLLKMNNNTQDEETCLKSPRVQSKSPPIRKVSLQDEINEEVEKESPSIMGTGTCTDTGTGTGDQPDDKDDDDDDDTICTVLLVSRYTKDFQRCNDDTISIASLITQPEFEEDYP